MVEPGLTEAWMSVQYKQEGMCHQRQVESDRWFQKRRPRAGRNCMAGCCSCDLLLWKVLPKKVKVIANCWCQGRLTCHIIDVARVALTFLVNIYEQTRKFAYILLNPSKIKMSSARRRFFEEFPFGRNPTFHVYRNLRWPSSCISYKDNQGEFFLHFESRWLPQEVS